MVPSSRGSSQPRDGTQVFCIGKWILYHWATWEAYGSQRFPLTPPRSFKIVASLNSQLSPGCAMPSLSSHLFPTIPSYYNRLWLYCGWEDSFKKKKVSKKDGTFKRWDVSQTHLDSSQALGSHHGGLPTDFPSLRASKAVWVDPRMWFRLLTIYVFTKGLGVIWVYSIVELLDAS